MKNSIFFFPLVFFTTIVLGQISEETHKQTIKKLIQESFDTVWSNLDSNAMDTYYTEDFLLLENGEVWNKDITAAYLDKAKLKQPLPKRENTIEIIAVKITNTTAWLAYYNYATFTINNKTTRKAKWLESATAILTEKGWKLVMLHSTRIQNE
jgi:hypothetical protein